MRINVNLFKNKHKNADNHPDYRGNGKNLEGELYKIAAWAKLDRNGNTYLSCVIEPDTYAQEQQEQAQSIDPNTETVKEKDDLPF